MSRKALFLFLLATIGIAKAHSAEIYKWVDENGVTHFGQRPSDRVEAESLKFKNKINSVKSVVTPEPEPSSTSRVIVNNSGGSKSFHCSYNSKTVYFGGQAWEIAPCNDEVTFVLTPSSSPDVTTYQTEYINGSSYQTTNQHYGRANPANAKLTAKISGSSISVSKQSYGVKKLSWSKQSRDKRSQVDKKKAKEYRNKIINSAIAELKAMSPASLKALAGSY